MAIFEVLNDSNEVINTIKADDGFMAANYDSYRLATLPDTSEKDARAWRDSELKRTDYIVPLSDHPERAAYMTYRVALRDWPSTDSFPTTKPNNSNYVAPEEVPPPPDPE
jgi:hypothetical protein